MRNAVVFCLTAVVFALGSPVTAMAGVPHQINVQGILTDASGNPITSAMTVLFAIWNLPIGGDSLWSEVQPVAPDPNGRFNVLLGTISPIPDSAFHLEAFLSFKVEALPELIPRQQLVSVAYAYRANMAEEAGVSFIAAPGSVNSASIQDKSIGFIDIGPNGAAPGQVVKWNGADWFPGNDETSPGSPSYWTVVDSVIFTNEPWGMTRGNAENAVLGSGARTLVNLGVACTTGASGSDIVFATVAGGSGNVANAGRSTVGGGYRNLAGNVEATVAGGQFNGALGEQSVVAGGESNAALGWRSSIGGGYLDSAQGDYSVIGGGFGNKAAGMYAIVGSGNQNRADGDHSVATGGISNQAEGSLSFIGGGYNNQALDGETTIGGGYQNIAKSRFSTIAGGTDNKTDGPVGLHASATVGGGSRNEAMNVHATIAGGARNIVIAPSATIGGGESNQATDTGAVVCGGGQNYARGRFSVVGGGGGSYGSSDSNAALGDWSVIGGGNLNLASDSFATVAGGLGNLASAEDATVSGGSGNHATGAWSTVAGGTLNHAEGTIATVGGGSANHSTAWGSTVSGGMFNQASGQYAVVSGGGGADTDDFNEASGDYSVIPGGRGNQASGENSLAAGRLAHATHGGSFVWADNTDNSFYSENTNEFAIHAESGLRTESDNFAYGAQIENLGAGDGIRAYANTSSGLSYAALYALNNGTSPAIYASSTAGMAGYFDGPVTVTGLLTKAVGGFKIDHPLAPANKYLNHSFVESPEMKNVYDGVVVLDASGEAWVQLPEWFETLNRDFRYQLTCIGEFAPVYIRQKIAGNRFKIAGGSVGMEVSWQVTGIRQDVWANAHRLTVEENKASEEQGKYLHPKEYNQPNSMGIGGDPTKEMSEKSRPR